MNENLADALADQSWTIFRTVALGQSEPLWVQMPAEERIPWLKATKAFWERLTKIKATFTLAELAVFYTGLLPGNVGIVPEGKLAVGAIVRFLADFYSRKTLGGVDKEEVFNWQEWVSKQRNLPQGVSP